MFGRIVADRSSFQSILVNLRDAAVDFCTPFETPGNIPTALGNLLKELGIADPKEAVMTQLQKAAQQWGSLVKDLSGLNLDAAHALDQVKDKADQVQTCINGILTAADTAWDELGAIAAAVKQEFAKRLLEYIIYEALTKSHEKIGGAFLLFGVLRLEWTPAPNIGFVDAMIRVFDLKQLIFVFTHPLEAILQALKWGTDDFNAQPPLDGLALLLGLLPGITKGPEKDTFPLDDEAAYVDRADLGGLKPSPRRSFTDAGQTLSFVGLHRVGIGVQGDNPVALSGQVGSFNPRLPTGAILALSPGNDRLKDPPVVNIFRKN